MGKKTHGPYLIQAIEANSHEKVHDICAKQVGHKDKVREMVTSHVKRMASDHSEIPLLLAAQLPDPSILTYFVHKYGIDLNHVFKEQIGRRVKIKTCLIMGVRRGLYDAVEMMLSSNADPNLQDHKGRSALHHAVRKADYRMAKMLLTRGAQPSLIDKGENTPLHVASIFGHVELCKMLMHYGADIYKKGQLGAIPIHIAAKEGHVSLLRLFCQQDVNPNIKMPCYDGREKAALHVACEEGHYECVSCLVESLGADPNLGDSEGETPLNCCVLHEYDPMGMKSKEDYTEAVKILIRNGAETNIQNGRGESALHLAARNEFHKIVELLLQAGVDPLLEDNSGDKAIDLVNEEDAVTRQIIKQAMENREQYLNDVFEMRAKGYSTSLDVLTSGRSTSALNRHDSMSSDASRMGRATSTPGLLGIPPNQMYGGYLQPLRNINGPHAHTAAQVHDLSNSRSHSSGSAHNSQSPEQTYAKIDPDITFEEHRPMVPPCEQPEDNGKKSKFGVPKFFKKKQDSGGLQRQASQKSTDSSQYDAQSLTCSNWSQQDRNGQGNSPQKPNIMPIQPGTRKLPSPPQSTVRDSTASTEVSNAWDKSNRSSTTTFREDGDFGVGKKTDELMAKLQQNFAAKKHVYSDINTSQYASLPGAPPSMEPKDRSTPTPQHKPPTMKPKIIMHEIAQNGMSDSDDTFFDDESFDSVSEATVEMVQQQQQKIEMANKELFDAKNTKENRGSPHMQKWISEQATLVQQRNFKNAGPMSQSTPSSSKVNQSAVVSDTDDQFTSVSQQVGRPVPPMKNDPIVDKNANSKPMPPPRPARTDRKHSTEREPKADKASRKHSTPSITSGETGNNGVHFEVDDKQPGQTVIRIMPASKKPATSPKVPKKNIEEDSSPTYANTTTTMSSSNHPEPQLVRPAQGRRPGTQGYRDGMLDADSMSEISTTSSFFRPIPKKRHKIIERIESRRDKEMSPSKRPVKTVKEDADIDSDLSDFAESDDENPDTAHITARFFIAPTLDSHPSELRSSQDLFEIDKPTPPTPTTPKIKMTMKSSEGDTPSPVKVQEKPPSKVKVLPEPPPKPKLSHPEPPPKPKPKPPTQAKPEPKPATPAKPEQKESPKIAKKPIIPKRDEKPKPPPTATKPPKVIHIEQAPKPAEQAPKIPAIATLVTEDNFSTGSLSEEEPLPTSKTKPKPAARKTVNHADVSQDVSHEVIPDVKPEDDAKAEKPAKEKKTKGKKKKKKEKGTKKTAEKPHEESEASLPSDILPVNTEPKAKPQEPPIQTGPIHTSETVNKSHEEDDTYLKPIQRPSIPIESTQTAEPAVMTSRQKRKMKKQQTKTNTVEETEEMKPVEPGVYQNSPPQRPKVQHTTANKDGVPYAMVDRSGKSATGGPPVFVKVDRSTSDLSEDSGGSHQAPPVPENPYAEISVVDDIQRPSQSTEALDLDTSKRRVTIGQNEYIPNNKKKAKDHDHRRIVYNCDDDVYFDIIGGNADGVFVHNVQSGSAPDHAGLRNGDKILKINNRSVIGKTREDVTAMVNGIKRTMDIVVRERHDIYKTILEHNGIGDAFCVRAHFAYKPQQKGELAINPGDIFSVKDTLPNNSFGYWYAVKLSAGPREQTNGYILNKLRAEQYTLNQRMSRLKAFEKQKGGFMKKGFNRSKSLDRLKKGKSQEDLSLDTGNTVAYERIEQRKSSFPKPVLLLGLFCDHVRDLLARDFPDKFVVPKDPVEMPGDARAPGQEPVRTDIIHSICSSGKHCLTILSPPSIEYLQKTELNPIVIYLAPGSKAIVKIIKNIFAPNMDRKAVYLYDEAAAFEKTQSHLFTASVPYTENYAWMENLKEMIRLLQEQPQWYVVKEEEPDDDDDDDIPSSYAPGTPEHAMASSHGGRLNRSMEHIPDPIENLLNVHSSGASQQQQRMRSQSHGGMLSSNEMDMPVKNVPKSILKNKGFSSNNSDSGSTSSASQSGKPPTGRPNPPNSFPPRPPQHSMTSMLQSPSSPSGQPGFFPPPQHMQQPYRQPQPQQPQHYPPSNQHGYRPPLQPAHPISHQQQHHHGNMLPGSQQQPHPGYHGQPGPGTQQQGYHPAAQQQQQQQRPRDDMSGFHPAFQQIGSNALPKQQSQANGKETAF